MSFGHLRDQRPGDLAQVDQQPGVRAGRREARLEAAQLGGELHRQAGPLDRDDHGLLLIGASLYAVNLYKTWMASSHTLTAISLTKTTTHVNGVEAAGPVTGLLVDITGLGVDGLKYLLLVLLVACTGTFVGASVAWHRDGVTHWDSPDWDEGTHGFNFMAQLYGCTAANGVWVVPGSHKIAGKCDIRAMVAAAGSERLPDAVLVVDAGLGRPSHAAAVSDPIFAEPRLAAGVPFYGPIPDVDAVHANFDVDAEVLERVAG